MSRDGKITAPSMPEQYAAGLVAFSVWFEQHYSAPNTVIHDPQWHAPKIFRAAAHALASQSAPIEWPVTVDELYAITQLIEIFAPADEFCTNAQIAIGRVMNSVKAANPIGDHLMKTETIAKLKALIDARKNPAPSEPTDTERLDLLEAQAREGPWNHTRQRQMFAGISYHPTLTLREAIDFARSLPNDR
jgi:hypothetical protein